MSPSPTSTYPTGLLHTDQDRRPAAHLTPTPLRLLLRQTAMTLSAPFNAHRPPLMTALALMMASVRAG